MRLLGRYAAGSVGALAALGLIAWGCGGGSSGPTAPSAPDDTELSQTQLSPNYRFHFAPGDGVDAEREEAAHTWVADLLGVASPGRIDYYKYRSLDHMLALTGKAGNGWAEPELRAVHSIYRWHIHEAVHVITVSLGRPSDFFNEGIAVALSVDPLAGKLFPSYSGRSAHEDVRALGAARRPLAEIVTTAGFRAIEETVGYPEAGSFVRYLLDEHGAAPLHTLFAAGAREDSLATIRTAFRRAYGTSLADAEGTWLAFLGIAETPGGAG